MRNRVLPTLIIGLVGAVIGSFRDDALREHAFYQRRRARTIRRRRSPRRRSRGVSDQDRIVSAVKRTKASVVAITEDSQRPASRSGRPVHPAVFRAASGPGIVQPYRGQASGSGFVFDSNGDIVTNAHVVNPPSRRPHLEVDGRFRQRRPRAGARRVARTSAPTWPSSKSTTIRSFRRRCNSPTPTGSSRASGRSRSANRWNCSRP